VDEWPRREFSPQGWQATPYWTGPSFQPDKQRFAFYRDMTERHLLDKKSADEIRRLLGPPHTQDRWCLLYLLKMSMGRSPGGGLIEIENAATWWLQIPLDHDQRARAVVIYPE
jgi:hypothetical protein